MSDTHTFPTQHTGSALSHSMGLQDATLSDPLPCVLPHPMTAAHLQPATQCLPPAQETRSVRRTKTCGALRLIKTQGLNRQEWLDVRKRGIGSSDAAAAVGLNPFESRLSLWLNKTGRDGDMPRIDPKDDTHPAYWGEVLEPIVAAHYSRRTGRKVRRVNAVLQHPDHPWMLANVDREIVGDASVQLLECKTTGTQGAWLWQQGVPEYVQLQVMHQLAVTGKQAADVAVLIAGQTLEIHRIERDEAVIEQLIDLERQFWYFVETDRAPPADGSDSADRALRQLFPRDAGTTMDFSEDEAMSAVFERLVQVRQSLGAQEREEGQLRQQIQQRMADASKAIFRSGEVSWRRSKDSTVLDTLRLLEDQPELLQTYGTTKPGSRRFLVKA
jgi:putative phage-type endonuclease